MVDTPGGVKGGKGYTLVDMYNLDVELETLDVAADKRAWQLEKLERQTRKVAELVREEYSRGESVQKLAKRAGVTRATIYAWLQDH